MTALGLSLLALAIFGCGRMTSLPDPDPGRRLTSYTPTPTPTATAMPQTKTATINVKICVDQEDKLMIHQGKIQLFHMAGALPGQATVGASNPPCYDSETGLDLRDVAVEVRQDGELKLWEHWAPTFGPDNFSDRFDLGLGDVLTDPADKITSMTAVRVYKYWVRDRGGDGTVTQFDSNSILFNEPLVLYGGGVYEVDFDYEYTI